MTIDLIEKNNLSTHSSVDGLSLERGSLSFTSRIRNQLVGRVALIGTSLLSQANAVGRAVLGCMVRAGSTSFNTLYAIYEITSFKKLLNYPFNRESIRHYDSKPRKDLSPEMRLERIRQGTELIASKLKNQFEHGQNQAAKEPDKAFQYLAAPTSFQGHVQSEEIAGYEVGISHFIGRRSSMEDEHLTTSFSLNVGGKDYPIQLLGIFDGHGGGQAALYVKNNLECKLHETLNEFCVNGLTDEAIWNALKITFVRLDQEFGYHFKSGTTATVAMILDGKLWTANVGDSRTILDNGIQLSEDAKLTDPRYQRGVENRGGFVFWSRVDGVLAVARSIGDHDVIGVNPRPKITVYPLSLIQDKSHLILTCDGIYDVSSTRQVAAAVRDHKDQSAAELAKNIVYSAYQVGSSDNLSALVVKL